MTRHPALAVLGALSLAACKTAGSPAPAAPSASAPAPLGIDPSLIDAKVSPCEDFYAYACGNWLAKTTIPADQGRWGRGFSEVEERNLNLLRALLDEMAAGRIDPEDLYGQKVADYYAACMDEETLEQRGPRDLLAAWARIDALRDVGGLARELATLHSNGVFALFEVGSDQDAKDATQVIGVVVQGGLTLPDRDYYLKTDEKMVGIQGAYHAYLVKALELAGLPEAKAGPQAEAIYGLEHQLAEAQWTRTEMRDPKRTYNRVELSGLERLAPHFGWSSYLGGLGHPSLQAFSTTTPRYLERIDELLAKTPLETWKSYLKWRLLSVAAGARALPKAFIDERFGFESRSFTGAQMQEPRWKDCVRTVDRGLGEALGQAFVRRYFGAEGKAKTLELVGAVEKAMGQDVDAIAWMDAPTRARAHQKLEALHNKIGYPETWRRYDALTVERASFFNSLLAARAFAVNRELEKIGKPVDRGEWHMTPPTVNAYYSAKLNEMVFPAGILQPPFFTRGAPDAVNYGAIGMVVGHELTHGFDDKGRQFDAGGNLADWWSPAVGQEFDRRAGCVAFQYDGYLAVDDLKLNGRLTLGENLADLGGLRLALAAYRASREGRGSETPIAGFAPEQAFFLAYAQAFCTAVRPEFARTRALTDPHSPPRWRVDGPLSNLAEFRQAFSCPAESRMVRGGGERCEVW